MTEKLVEQSRIDQNLWVRDIEKEGYAQPNAVSQFVISCLIKAPDLKFLVQPRFVVFQNRWLHLIPIWVLRLNDEITTTYPKPDENRVVPWDDDGGVSIRNHYDERDALFLDAVRSALEIKK